MNKLSINKKVVSFIEFISYNYTMVGKRGEKMKKSFRIFMVMMFAILLTGCGSKKYDVKCTQTIEKYEITIGANFKNNKLSDVTTEMTFDTEENAKTMYDMVKSSDENKYELNKKTVSSKVTNLSEQEQVTKDEFMKTMEDQKYKCK